MQQTAYPSLTDIPGFEQWTKIEPIPKGWSQDQKFYIETQQQEKRLLRLANAERCESKRNEFYAMQAIAAASSIHMSQPLDFGYCSGRNQVYTLLSWVNGESLDEVLSGLSVKQQFALGCEAGQLLHALHSVPVLQQLEDWETRMQKKIRRHQERYMQSGLHVPHDECALQYIEKHIALLQNRPQTFQHGDFHVGNLILTPENGIGVIDFNRWDYGDPYEEFYKMMIFSRETSLPFAQGQLKGYFADGIPDDFWPLVALYLADVVLFSVVWALPFGEAEVQGMMDRARMIFQDLDYFRAPIPQWFNLS